MKARLENQIAIVTGSSSGNGRAIALALSSEGATVVCADLSKNARKEGYEEDIEIDTDDPAPKYSLSSRFSPLYRPERMAQSNFHGQDHRN